MHLALEENNFCRQAESMSRKALEINCNDASACHTMSHCYEIKFMTETKNSCADTGLSCHNYWHLALHYYEKGEFEYSFGILDKQIINLRSEKSEISDWFRLIF